MLHKHYRTVAQINADVPIKYLLRDYFDLPRWQAIMPALLARALGQADLVLALLRIRDRHCDARAACEHHVAMLIGHSIQFGRPCLIAYRTNGPPSVRLDRSPRIAWVHPTNPRQPNTDAWYEWREYRVGRTVAQLRARGLKPRDIRRTRARGWIKLEEVA